MPEEVTVSMDLLLSCGVIHRTMSKASWRFRFRLWHLFVLILLISIALPCLSIVPPELQFTFRGIKEGNNALEEGPYATIDVANAGFGGFWTRGQEYLSVRQVVNGTSRDTGYSVEPVEWKYLRSGQTLRIEVPLIKTCDSIKVGVFVDTGLLDAGRFVWSKRIDLRPDQTGQVHGGVGRGTQHGRG